MGDSYSKDAANRNRRVWDGQLFCKGTDQETSITPMQALTSVPDGSRAVSLQAITQDVYVTFDASTPSATNGMRLIATQIYFFNVDPTNILIVQQASGAILNVTYWGDEA